MHERAGGRRYRRERRARRRCTQARSSVAPGLFLCVANSARNEVGKLLTDCFSTASTLGSWGDSAGMHRPA